MNLVSKGGVERVEKFVVIVYVQITAFRFKWKDDTRVVCAPAW